MKISASPQYMGKEAIRQALQNVVQEYVRSGKIKNQEQLNEFWDTIDLASKALKGIPYDVFSRVVTVREVREIVREVLRENSE
jgi:hypothetical protein